MIRPILAALALSTLTSPLLAATWGTGQYRYDGQGNVKAIGGDRFGYDALGRLVRGDADGHTQQLTYDRYGNILTVATGTDTIRLGVDPATNRLTDDTANVFGTYDGAGRLTEELDGAGNVFAYDGTDMVTGARVDGAQKVYLYTANDERVVVVDVAGGTEGLSEWVIRDASKRVLRRLRRTGGAWSWKQDYVHHAGKVLAAEVATPEKTLHFHPDHLGTPRLITTAGGTRLALHTYYPFGGEVTSPSQDAEEIKFTGHERDSQSLDYMHARYYNPKWGRFVSVDRSRNPLKALSVPQAWNRYAYARNSPHTYIDPNGLDEIKWGKTTVTIWPGEVLYIRSGNNDHVATYVGTDSKGAINVVDSTHDRNANLTNIPERIVARNYPSNTGDKHEVHDIRAPVNGKPNPFGPEKATVIGVIHHDKGNRLKGSDIVKAASEVREYHHDVDQKQCTTFCETVADEADYQLIDLNDKPLEDTRIWTFLKAADQNMVKK